MKRSRGDAGLAGRRLARLGRSAIGSAALCASLALAMAPDDAHAYAMDGKLGIGFEETLIALDGGARPAGLSPDIRASGLGMWGWINDFGWEFLVGMHLRTAPDKAMSWAAFASLGGHFAVFRSPRVNLTTGLRVTLGLARADDGAKADPATRAGFAIEAPLRALYFFSDQFSIVGSLGPVLAINGDARSPLTGSTTSNEFTLFRGGFGGGVGFCVWLR